MTQRMQTMPELCETSYVYNGTVKNTVVYQKDLRNHMASLQHRSQLKPSKIKDPKKTKIPRSPRR